MTILSLAERPIPETNELLRHFEEDCVLRRMSPETIRSYRSYLRIIGRFLEGRGRTFVELTTEDLRAILAYVVRTREVRSTLSVRQMEQVERTLSIAREQGRIAVFKFINGIDADSFYYTWWKALDVDAPFWILGRVL